VAGLLMMWVAARAHAGWRESLSLLGTPNHVVDVWGRGKFSVGFGQGAYLLQEGQTPLPHVFDGSHSSVGTYFQETAGCFVSLLSETGGDRRSLGLNGTSPCSRGGNTALMSLSAPPVLRVRHSKGSAAAVSYNDPLGGQVFLSDTSIYEDTRFMLAFGVEDQLNGTLGLTRVGSRLYALVGSNSNKGQVYWVDSDKRGAHQFQSELPVVGITQAIDLFAAGSPALPHAVVGTQFAILQGPLRDIDSLDPKSDLRPVWRPAVSGGGGVTGISMNVDATNVGAYGHGFGMAVLELSAGSYAVASPVPMPDATRAGTRWKLRTLPDDMKSAPLNQVACADANYCVISAKRANSGNLFIYSNDARPGFPAGTTVELNEGQSGQFTFEASDTDGDPVLTLAASPSQGGAQWSAEQVGVGVGGGWLPGDPVVMNVTAGAVCKDEQVGTLKLRASDGWAAHDVEQDIPVNVRHTRRPDVPAVSFSKGGLKAGEQEPLIVQVRQPYAGCPLTGFHWSARPVSTGLVGPTLTQDGSSSATLTAPPTLCAAGGADFPFQLMVEDSSGLTSSVPGVFQVHVAPWGKPNAVFDASDGGVLIAGQSRELSPTRKLHECVGTGGFPGVETTWRVTSDRALSEGGITLLDANGNPVEPGAEVRSPKLLAKTTDCVDTTHLTFTAVNHLREGAADLAGPASEQHVTVETSLAPFGSGQLQLEVHPVTEPSGELRVEADSNLNCPVRRGLRAHFELSPPGGGRKVSGQVPIQDAWEVSLGEQCLGGRLELTSWMADDAGNRSSETKTEVVAPPVRAGMDALPADTALVASCNEGARTTLTPTFPRGFCQSPDVSWKQVSGPEVTQRPEPGGGVSLSTKETGLDTLVGEFVEMEATARASPESQASLRHELRITVEPFVKVSRRAEVPAASDTGLVGVSVELTNTTACDVNNVSYEERLEGLTYVEGSAQVEGQEGVEVSGSEGVLSVTGLSLAGHSTRRLTYVARPHLVGTRRMEGEARLRDVPISIKDKPGPRVDETGCGCTSSGPGPVLFALGALVAAARRRRR
jgi:MYXO-CTERM domain-containing protein